MARKKQPCPVKINGVRCLTMTQRGSIFCAEHAKLVTTGLVPCTGEAHSNPYIDHCMMCAPYWGMREVLVAIEGSHEHNFVSYDKWNTQCTLCGCPKPDPIPESAAIPTLE